MSQIIIRAASPDNELYLRQLVDLYHRCFGADFPLKQVYRVDYWKTRIGTQNISLLAFDQSDLVAHVALRPDPDNRNHIQVLYPVVDPEAYDLLPQIHQAAKRVIDRLAERQQWRMMYHFSEAADRMALSFITGDLGLIPCAIIPDYLRAHRWINSANDRDSSPARAAVALSARVFVAGSADDSPVWIEPRHKAMVASLYKSMGLTRDLSERPLRSLTAVGRADDRAIHLVTPRGCDVAHAFIEPGLFASPEDGLRALDEIKDSRACLFLNLHDPATAQFSEALTQAGYIFAGILPLTRERDRAIYVAKPDRQVADQHLINPQVLALAQYVDQASKRSSGVEKVARFFRMGSAER